MTAGTFICYAFPAQTPDNEPNECSTPSRRLTFGREDGQPALRRPDLPMVDRSESDRPVQEAASMRPSASSTQSRSLRLATDSSRSKMCKVELRRYDIAVQHD